MPQVQWSSVDGGVDMAIVARMGRGDGHGDVTWRGLPCWGGVGGVLRAVSTWQAAVAGSWHGGMAGRQGLVQRGRATWLGLGMPCWVGVTFVGGWWGAARRGGRVLRIILGWHGGGLAVEVLRAVLGWRSRLAVAGCWGRGEWLAHEGAAMACNTQGWQWWRVASHVGMACWGRNGGGSRAPGGGNGLQRSG
ncbi:hypothetical protein EDB89DRAFT_1909132 [Lactarius sanguifluus]|nr:hypothetical protein EDB89DRAFT_1909132 [Lactarius sanguifluus]